MTAAVPLAAGFALFLVGAVITGRAIDKDGPGHDAPRRARLPRAWGTWARRHAQAVRRRARTNPEPTRLATPAERDWWLTPDDLEPPQPPIKVFIEASTPQQMAEEIEVTSPWGDDVGTFTAYVYGYAGGDA